MTYLLTQTDPWGADVYSVTVPGGAAIGIITGTDGRYVAEASVGPIRVPLPGDFASREAATAALLLMSRVRPRCPATDDDGTQCSEMPHESAVHVGPGGRCWADEYVPPKDGIYIPRESYAHQDYVPGEINSRFD